MRVQLITPPALEPISLQEIKLHCKIDSGSFADNIDETQSIAPGLKAFIDDWTTHAGAAVEVLGYNAIVSFTSGANTGAGTVDVKIQDSDDNITYVDWGTAFTQVTVDGMLTSAALAIGTTLTNVANGLFTYFIAGVPYSKPAYGAGTAPGNDVIPMGKYGAVALDIGADNAVDVIEAAGNAAGYNTAALAIAGIPAVAASHVRMGTVTAMKSDGAFTFGATALNAVNSTVAYTQATLKANYNTTYEKAYTGTKRWIKTPSKVLVADCSFGTSVIRSLATSVEDDWLNDTIAEARQYVEDITRRGILTQTWDYYLQEWPDGDRLKIPFGNLQTVTHIKYKESDWASVADDKTLTLTTDYLVETNGDQCGFIVLPYCGSWPSATLYPSNPITIRFVCGWTTAALVARNLRAMIKLHCADKYKHRGEGITGHIFVEDKAFYRLRMIETLWDEF